MGEVYIVEEGRVEEVFADKEYKIVGSIKGSDLVGTEYKPIFDYLTNSDSINKNAYTIYSGDWVTAETGTGIVHIAPTHGQDDLNLAVENNLPIIFAVNLNGTYKDEVTDFVGEVKPRENPQSMDIEIIKKLASIGSLWAKKKITHSYPHCWRCKAPLLNYSINSWIVEMTKVRGNLIAQNQKINWIPSPY